MEMYFTEQGKLVFDGYDIGKSVSEFWGDSDYEYKYTIEQNGVAKLFHLFGLPNSDRALLLREIKKRFGENDAYSKFGDFLRENDIDFDSFTWA